MRLRTILGTQNTDRGDDLAFALLQATEREKGLKMEPTIRKCLQKKRQLCVETNLTAILTDSLFGPYDPLLFESLFLIASLR